MVDERLRVARGDASADILQVNQLTKVYQNLSKRVQAVKKLSVGIPAGEVCAICIVTFIMRWFSDYQQQLIIDFVRW